MDPIRSDRLKAALRGNLKRRKAQARARQGGEGEGGERGPPERVKSATVAQDVAPNLLEASKGDEG